MAARSLLRNGDFRRLWLADGFSQFGNRVAVLAVPLLAATALHASTFEVSLLRTVQTAAYLVLGLQAGAWCDRLRLRPLLIGTDLGQAVAFASVPIAAAFGVLSLTQLYVVVGIAGVLAVFGTVAHQTYLPRLIGPDDLVEGNAKLYANLSVSAVAAPGATGFLMQFLGGPAAIAVNAASFVWSALWLRGIRQPEVRPERTDRVPLRREIGEGIAFIVRHRVLRLFAGNTVQTALFQSTYMTLSVLYMLRELRLSALGIGLLSAFGLTGAIAGSATAQRLGARFGAGRTVWLSSLVLAAGYLVAPLSRPGWLIALYALGAFLCTFAITVANVHMVSFIQAETPAEMRGRVTATNRFLIFGMGPIGSLAAGALGETIGLRNTLWIGAAGTAAAALWLFPLRGQKES
ncbi:MAG TPA: MFS transporter [Amycolatopsis sp.]|nr:MFS transporter [Amycolatopsis sp.]